MILRKTYLELLFIHWKNSPKLTSFNFNTKFVSNFPKTNSYNFLITSLISQLSICVRFLVYVNISVSLLIYLDDSKSTPTFNWNFHEFLDSLNLIFLKYLYIFSKYSSTDKFWKRISLILTYSTWIFFSNCYKFIMIIFIKRLVQLCNILNTVTFFRFS